MKIQVFLGTDGWRYRIIARNGRKLCVSEAYSSAYAAERAANAFRDFWYWNPVSSVKIEVVS